MQCVVQNVFQKNMTQTTWHEEFAESKVMEEKRPQGCVTIATEELIKKKKRILSDVCSICLQLPYCVHLVLPTDVVGLGTARLYTCAFMYVYVCMCM